MGDASADVWTAELQRTGRVAFPQRPRAFVPKLVVAAWPAVLTVHSFPEMLAEGGFARVLALLVLALFIGCLGYLAWQAVTGRPVLIVDRQGIRSGRKSMPWTEIGAIGIPHGPRFIRTLPIIPANVWAKDLTLSQENVQDFRAFAHWLEEVLRDQRQPAVTDGLATE